MVIPLNNKTIEEQRRRAAIDTTMLAMGKKALKLSVKHGMEREKLMIEEEQRRLNALQAEDNEFSKLFGDKEATQYRKIHKDLLKFW